MKKLVIAALAIGAMAACTKSTVQYEQPGEISLQPVTQKATKAAIDGNDYPDDGHFKVWAWWTAKAANTSLSDINNPTLYLQDSEFAKKNNDSKWGGWKDGNPYPYYWPTTGSLVFAGYSPASVGGGTFSFDNGTFTLTDFTQPNDIANAVDLMWFDFTTTSYNQKSNVEINFQHALSWLTFKFNLSTPNTEPMWTITDVKLIGIENKATFTSTNNWTVPVESDTNADVDVIDLFNNSENDYTVRYAEDGTVLPGTDTGVDGVKKNAVLVIPQSCAKDDASIVITFDQKTYVGEGKLTGQTKTLPLNGDNITNNMWEQGKHYIYTITFGNEILISPKVTDWTDINQNIEVQ